MRGKKSEESVWGGKWERTKCMRGKVCEKKVFEEQVCEGKWVWGKCESRKCALKKYLKTKCEGEIFLRGTFLCKRIDFRVWTEKCVWYRLYCVWGENVWEEKICEGNQCEKCLR